MRADLGVSKRAAEDFAHWNQVELKRAHGGRAVCSPVTGIRAHLAVLNRKHRHRINVSARDQLDEFIACGLFRFGSVRNFGKCCCKWAAECNRFILFVAKSNRPSRSGRNHSISEQNDTFERILGLFPEGGLNEDDSNRLTKLSEPLKEKVRKSFYFLSKIRFRLSLRSLQI